MLGVKILEATGVDRFIFSVKAGYVVEMEEKSAWLSKHHLTLRLCDLFVSPLFSLRIVSVSGLKVRTFRVLRMGRGSASQSRNTLSKGQRARPGAAEGKELRGATPVDRVP